MKTMLLFLFSGAAMAGNVQIADPANLCTWTFSGSTLTCAAAAQGAPTCTTSATPNPVAASGGVVTLSASCSGGTLGAWSSTLPGATIAGNRLTVPANGGAARSIVAAVQACNGSACATFQAQTMQSGTVAVGCGNLSVIPFGGSGDLAYEVRYSVSGMSDKTVALGRFRTGNAGQDTAQFGLADVTGAGVAQRKLYITAAPCDFIGAAGTAGPALYPTFRYTVGANLPISRITNLQPNAIYYVMAKQENSLGPNCQNGGCGFSLVLHATNNP